MALLDSEVARIKYELGYNLLGIGAIPYIGITQMFEQVVQPYLSGGATTSSSTPVTASTTAAPATLVIADVTGFVAGARVVVDVDDRQEIVTVQALAGNTITALFKLAHTGTYPVTVEGGETVIREILARLRGVHAQINAATATAGIRRVDVIEFFGNTASTAQLASLERALSHWRRQLASALGVVNLWEERSAGSLAVSNY